MHCSLNFDDGGWISRGRGQQVKDGYIRLQHFILNSWVNFLPPNYLWPILKRHDDNSINSFEIWKVDLGAAIRKSLGVVCLTVNDAGGRVSDGGSVSASQGGSAQGSVSETLQPAWRDRGDVCSKDSKTSWLNDASASLGGRAAGRNQPVRLHLQHQTD